MSITLAVAPGSQFMFSRQPISIEASTNNLIATAGVKFARTITFITAPITAGVVFEITWNGITVHMESETGTLTLDGEHYRAKNIIGETLADWIEHFAEDVASNFYIGNDFDITYTTTTITFTAKQTGSDYNITFTDIPGTVTTDYTLGTETTGVTEVLNSNFNIFIDLFTELSAEPDRIAMWRSDKESTGYFEKQIQTILHGKLTSPFPHPSNVDDVIALAAGDLLLKYWFRYFEYYGSPAEAKYYYLNTNSGEYFYVLMGGHYLAKNQDFLSTYDTQFLFLTFQPRTKYVTRDQPEWQYWFVGNTDSLTGNLELKIYYTDASTTTVNYPWDISAEDGLRAMYKAVGYFQIVEPNIASGKTVERWTIRIVPTDEVEPLSSGETFTYYPITDGTPWYKHMVFRNSFGGYDTLRITGVMQTGIDVTGQILNQFLDDDYLPSDGTMVNSESENQITHTVAVPYMEREQMIDLLREIFVFPKAALVQEDTDADDGSVIQIPVVIEPASIKIKQSDEMLYSFEFKFREAFKDTGVPEVVS